MTTSNASLFRRFARAEDTMLRGSMPKTQHAEAELVADTLERRVIAQRAGSRLVKTLTATLAERAAI